MIEHFLSDMARRPLPMATVVPDEVEKLRILHMAGHLRVTFLVVDGREQATIHALTPLGAKVINCFASTRQAHVLSWQDWLE